MLQLKDLAEQNFGLKSSEKLANFFSKKKKHEDN